ncbi:hypothetical protein [Verrucosispora sioxanthis]|uniref:hypothetical protein n=1 Tax=Verrucosispora sioxanthis TaxID=2499994 RepID=UPI00209E22C6|nr:hypothetical protein [Verrucosispora sioxanthis]
MAIGTWFATEFDEPIPARELPATFTSGGDPDVLLADQVARGVAIVGRVQSGSGAVVLKIRTDGRPVRVRVDLHVDGASQTAWSRAAAPTRGMRELPRLVMVRAQGADRAAALISRQRGRLRMVEAHAWVEFDLRAGEVGDDGLLIVEVVDGAVPPWAATELSPLAAIGVRINQVEIVAIDAADQREGAARPRSGPGSSVPAAWSGREVVDRDTPGRGSSWSTPPTPPYGAGCGSRPARPHRPRCVSRARSGCAATRARPC